MTFSLVHISDLHYTIDQPSKNRLRVLREDIIETAKQGRHYLLFSGDLALSGDDSLYLSLLDEFFVHVDDVFERIYLVPGNHDVKRSRALTDQCHTLLQDIAQSYLYDHTAGLKLTNPFTGIDPFANYNELRELVGSHQEVNYFGSIDRNKDFAIVCLNSAWLSCSRAEGVTDLGRLRIDPATIDHFAGKLDDRSLNVCMMHHPLEWMSKDARQHVENTITRNFDLVLYGHAHSPTTTLGFFNAGKSLFVQAPAVKSDRAFGSDAYSIINVDKDNKKFEIVYRTYSQSRNRFVPGEELAEGGVKYPSEQDRTHWRRLRTGTKSGLVAQFNSQCGNIDFDEWYESNIIAKSKHLHGFVEPKLVRLQFRDGDRIENPPLKLSKALKSPAQRQFVVGARDSGLTTAAFLTAKHIAQNFDEFSAVPIYVNLNGIQITRASLVREASKAAFVTYNSSQVRTLAEEGGIYFVFDQIGLPETEKFNKLVQIMDRHFAKVRWIAFCAFDGGLLRTAATNDLTIDPTSDTIFELTQMDVNDIRELVEVYRPSANQGEVGLVLRNVVASFQQMNEPVYPSAVSLLLETLRQIPEFRPINRARLIDRYVECLLGRLDWQDVVEGTFNSNDKVNFLAYIAGEFATRGLHSASSDEWAEICEKYAADKLLDLPDGLLVEFTLKGILLHHEGRITFRADYLFTYFVAKEMNLNQKVFDHITSKDGFFVNYRELIFYGELEGVDNGKLLDETYERIRGLEERIEQSYAKHGVSLEHELQNMLTENSDEDGQMLVNAVRRVLRETPSTGTVDRALTRDLTNVDRGRGIAKRSNVKELEAQWLVAIRTYFQLIKHGTNLSADQKMKHLNKAFESAEMFIMGLAAKRGIISREPAYFHSGVLYINPLAESDPERAKREFKLHAPNSFGELLAELITNAQLAPAFRKLLDGESEIISFLARHVLLEIPEERNRRAFGASLGSAKDVVLKTCSLSRLKYKYLGYAISDESKDFYEGIIRDIAGNQSLLDQASQELLRKKRLFVEMKKKISGRTESVQDTGNNS